MYVYISGFFLEKIHKGENINGEGAKRPSGGEGEVEMDHSEACEGPVC